MPRRQELQAAIGSDTPQEGLAPPSADDPIVAAIKEDDGNRPLSYKGGDMGEVRPESPHRGPAGVQRLADRIVINIMSGKFEKTWIDKPQPVACTHQQEQP